MVRLKDVMFWICGTLIAVNSILALIASAAGLQDEAMVFLFAGMCFAVSTIIYHNDALNMPIEGRTTKRPRNSNKK